MFDRSWDRVMQNHHAMTGTNVPNMSLFDASWNMIMDKHEEMWTGREVNEESDFVAVSEVDEVMESREEIVEQVDAEEDRFALHTIYEDDAYEGEEAFHEAEDPSDNTLYDKSWDRVMHRQHEELRHDGLSEGDKAHLASPRSPLQLWLLALCFGYLACCGLQRLVHEEHQGTPDPACLEHVVSHLHLYNLD